LDLTILKLLAFCHSRVNGLKSNKKDNLSVTVIYVGGEEYGKNIKSC
jgi:hypothetical protein